MNKVLKVAYVMMVAVLIVACSSMVFATEWINVVPGGSDLNANGIKTMAGTAIDFVITIGMILSIVILLWIGIKYMIQSPDGKAEYQKNLIPYVVGCVLVFAACGIAKAIYTLTSSVQNSLSNIA